MAELASELRLPASTQLIHLNLGCSGLATAIPLAHGELLRQGGKGNVLLVASQCSSGIAHDRHSIQRYSRHKNPWAWLGPAVFSDGSGAAVLRLGEANERRGVLHTWSASVPSGMFLRRDIGGARNPATAENVERDVIVMDPSWVGENFAPRMLEMYARLQDDWATHVEPLLGRSFDPRGIDLWFFHQANLVQIEEVVRRLEIPRDKAPCNVDRIGNASGASTLILLDETRKCGRAKPGDVTVFFWIGGGNGAQYGYSIAIL